MVFLPREPASRFACEYEIERAIKDEGQVLLGWRDVPVDNADLAEPAKKLEPVIRQVFVGRGAGVTVTDALERKLYIIRKSSGHAIQALKLAHGKEFYVPSMSPGRSSTRHADGLPGRPVLQGPAGSARRVGARDDPPALLDEHVPDLGPGASVPADRHNGEINTLRATSTGSRAAGAISSPILGDDLAKIWPLIYPASRTRRASTTPSRCS